MINTAIWTTAITGVTAIGVAALAPMVTARLTRRQWQRDQKVHAYTHLTGLHRLLLLTNPANFSDAQSQAQMATRNTVQVLELQTALAEVELVCPDTIRVLVENFGELLFPSADPPHADARQTAWNALIDAMRADLGTR